MLRPVVKHGVRGVIVCRQILKKFDDYSYAIVLTFQLNQN